MKMNLKENHKLQQNRNRIEKMFFEHRKLVFERADDYRRQYNLSEAIYEGLISVGIVALFKAVVNFNCEKRVKFSEYARKYLHKTMDSYLTHTIFSQNSSKARSISLR